MLIQRRPTAGRTAFTAPRARRAAIAIRDNNTFQSLVYLSHRRHGTIMAFRHEAMPVTWWMLQRRCSFDLAVADW